jgi:cyanophycinase
MTPSVVRTYRLDMRLQLLVFCAIILLAAGFYLQREIHTQVDVLTPTSSFGANLHGMLVICGGGEVPATARRTFVELAGGSAAKLVIIPGTQEDEDSLPSYYAVWKDFHPAAFHILNASSRDQANDPEFTKALDDATGVWFGGGQQNWLINLYANTLVEQKLRDVLKRQGVIGGTSAGAAVMSEVMVVGGRKNPVVGKGFGFIPDVVIDQHFLKRNRLQRLRSVLDEHTDLIGLGVDEQTAIVYSIASKSLRVVGNSYVVACVPGQSGLDIEFLQAGDERRLSEFTENEDSMLASTVEQVLFE